MVTTLI